MSGTFKAQSGIELAVFFSFMMLIFIILSIEASTRMQIIQRNRADLEAERAGGLVATHINNAVSIGDGYSAKFYLPQSLTNSNYFLNISAQTQRLEIIYGDNFTKGFPMLTSNITGLPKAGLNIINNTKGGIYFA
jgi:hypothetical protein